ncbi:hypothetical protein Vretimale_18070, partial [Volvox reticuliferus]
DLDKNPLSRCSRTTPKLIPPPSLPLPLPLPPLTHHPKKTRHAVYGRRVFYLSRGSRQTPSDSPSEPPAPPHSEKHTNIQTHTHTHTQHNTSRTCRGYRGEQVLRPIRGSRPGLPLRVGLGSHGSSILAFTNRQISACLGFSCSCDAAGSETTSAWTDGTIASQPPSIEAET